MKVTLGKDYKRWMTIEDLENAKKLINQMKEDESTAAEWAEYAVNEYLKGKGDYFVNCIEAKATVSGNSRIWDYHFEGSKNLDIWIKATCRTADGFIIIGAYLSDIYQTGAVPYKNHIYAQYFKRVETA